MPQIYKVALALQHSGTIPIKKYWFLSFGVSVCVPERIINQLCTCFSLCLLVFSGMGVFAIPSDCKSATIDDVNKCLEVRGWLCTVQTWRGSTHLLLVVGTAGPCREECGEQGPAGNRAEWDVSMLALALLACFVHGGRGGRIQAFDMLCL